jgi:hypothetical protein
MIVVSLLLALLLQAPTGTIEGIVVRQGTVDPIEGAQVLLAKADIDPGLRTSLASATTDSEGRFALTGIDDGKYDLLFAANGYVRQEYGQKAFPGNGSPITLSSGQSIKDFKMEMTPAAIVAGRILDSERRPLVAVPVQLMRYLYDETGTKTLRPFGTAQTDDRGEYRLYFVTPGRYYIHAGTPQGPGGFGGPRLGSNELQTPTTSAYYPGVADVRQATVVDVQPGAVLGAMDFRLSEQPLYSIRGRVVDAVTGQPPETPTLFLFHFAPDVGRPASITNSSRNTERQTYDKGTFEFRSLLPGSYTVGISERPNTAGNQRAMRFGFSTVDVVASDLENIVVTIPPGASIPGVIALEDQAPLASAFQQGYIRFVSLTRSANEAVPSMPRDWEAGTRLGEDGTFRLDGVTPGEYRITIQGLDPRYYIKEARYGVTDVLSSPLKFTGEGRGRFEILLSSRVAAVEGIVTNNRLQPAKGARVVLVPDRFRDRPELFKTAIADDNGGFAIPNVAPGDYKVFAWESIGSYFWFDPDIQKRDEPLARAIRLTESSKAMVNMQVMPAR